MLTQISSLKTKMALIISITLWASAFVGIRIGLVGYSPGSLALFRFLIASLCMVFIYISMPKRPLASRKDLFLMLLFGAIGIGSYNVFLNYGEMSVPAGIASFIISQSPLLTLVLAVMFLSEKFNLITLVGILISIVGVGLIAFGEGNDLKFDTGLLFIFLAALVSGIYSVLQKSFLNKYHALNVTIYIVWGGTIALLFYLPDLIHDIKTAPLNSTLAIVYLGIFPAAIAYIAWGYALAAIPATQCVSFLYFMPIIATVLGWVCLGEMPALLSLAGGLIALVGVWVTNTAFVKR